MKYFSWLIVLALLLFSGTAGLMLGLRLAGLPEEAVLPLAVEDFVPARLSLTPTPTPRPTLAAIPASTILPGGTHSFQTFNNCGPASLSMALSLHGVSVSQQELGLQIRPYQNPQGDNDDKSVTFAELAGAAQQRGFLTYHRPAGDIALLEQLVANELPVITRTLLTTDQDIGHYRVVKGYDRTAGVLIQDDSLQGANLRYKYQDFLALWQAFNYEFLVLVPQEKQALAESILGGLVDQDTAWQQALELAETELAINPNSLAARLNRSVALYHLGRFEESTADFESVEGRLPFRTLWYQLEPILAYYQLGEYDRVLAITGSILAGGNRANSELHWLRGRIFAQQGNQPAADAALAQAERYNQTDFWRANLVGVN